MEEGVVKWFNPRKNYGFIQRENGKDVFVHGGDIISDSYDSLDSSDRVQFDIEEGPKGLKAINVKKI
ncbi:cold-shock protein [bacterium SM23_31]|nr:MAG: cold-shock protein [bacterium SM23_31]